MKQKVTARLSVISLAISLGLVWGLSMLITGFLAYYMQYGNTIVTMFGGIYPGYQATVAGALWGGLWGFIDGLVGGFFIALFYNILLCCCGCKKSECN